MRLTTYDTPIKAWEMAFTERRDLDGAERKIKDHKRASVHCANLDSGTGSTGAGPRLATTCDEYGPKDVHAIVGDYWRES